MSKSLTQRTENLSSRRFLRLPLWAALLVGASFELTGIKVNAALFWICLALSIALTFLAKETAKRLNIVYTPGRLDVHSYPIPRTGGIAMFLTFAVVGYGAYRFNYLNSDFLVIYITAILSSGVIFIVGLIDDMKRISPFAKLLGQITAVIVLIGMTKVIPLGLLGVLLVVLYVVGSSNAMNLLDGIDGLAGGVSAIAFGFFALLSYMAESPIGIAISLCLLGICLGFLFFNWHPADVFMGDSGSLFLGFMCAFMLILLLPSQRFDLRWILGPLLVVTVPIFDTLLAVVQRRANRKPIFSGDRSHFYDKLIDMGFSQEHTVLICSGMGFFFGLSALFVVELPIELGLGLIFVETIGLIVIARKLKSSAI